MDKQTIINALRAFAEQRPGLEPANYGSRTGYDTERRRIHRQLREARRLLRAVDLRSYVTADHLRESFRTSFSGRRTLRDDGTLDYCVGQFWSTEFRAAVCAVLAGAFWAAVRDSVIPPGDGAGDRIREFFRREFGPVIAGRWFDWESPQERAARAARMAAYAAQGAQS